MKSVEKPSGTGKRSSMRNPLCAPHRNELPPASEGEVIDLTHSIDGTMVFNLLCETVGKPKGMTRSMNVYAFPRLQVVILAHRGTCECRGSGETVLTYEQILEHERKRAQMNRGRPQKGAVIRSLDKLDATPVVP